jgi:Ca2+-binding RTX toxin-like protein
MYIAGTGASDVLDGTAAADTIDGLSGNDLIRGAGGNDTLLGGNGNDSLEGAGGNDRIIGGNGNDTALYAGNTSPVLVVLAARDFYDDMSGVKQGTVSFPNDAWAPETLVSIENVTTGSGDDTLIGDLYDNVLHGGAGDDLLLGGLGRDTLIGGAGDDSAAFYWQDHFTNWAYDEYRFVDASAGVVARLTNVGGWLDIHGNAAVTASPTPIDQRQQLEGIENLSTGFGNDALYGNNGANALASGDGDDLLSGGRGADTLLGGNGDDTLLGGGGTDVLDGGEGFDTADYSDSSTNIIADLRQSIVSFPGRNWAPEALLFMEGARTGSGSDLLLGTGSGDYLAGSGGNDTLRGRGGDDTLDGGYGTDRIEGGGGLDTVDYTSVSDPVQIRIGAQRGEIFSLNGTLQSIDTFSSVENAIGGSGNDTLLGNSGVNVFDGSDGSDLIETREGDDTILLSSGDDWLDGGSGVDTLVIDHSEPVVGAASYEYHGYDTGYLAYITTSYEADSYVDLSARVASGDGAYGGTSTLTSIENVDIRAGWGADTVIGSDADNVIRVGLGANLVRGNGGDDVIYGGSADRDSHVALFEEFGWEVLAIEDGSPDEQLFGNGGDDTLYGSGLMDGGQATTPWFPPNMAARSR